jgi:hypothetical protein
VVGTPNATDEGILYVGDVTILWFIYTKVMRHNAVCDAIRNEETSTPRRRKKREAAQPVRTG